MPSFKAEFNLNSIVQVVFLAVMLVTIGTMYRSLTATDEMIIHRLGRVEAGQKRSDDDHDLLIEIRQDLRLLRQQVERMAAAGRMGAVDRAPAVSAQ